jgi:hypothetical protein
MPEVDEDDASDDGDLDDHDTPSGSRKRKSWSGREDEDESEDEDGPPRQRKRSNSVRRPFLSSCLASINASYRALLWSLLRVGDDRLQSILPTHHVPLLLRQTHHHRQSRTCRLHRH